jgi:AAT family amino acid transporter
MMASKEYDFNGAVDEAPPRLSPNDLEKSEEYAQAPEYGQGGPSIRVEDRLARKLTARQVQMIAIGGTIGTGLFLGTGKSLATGGPASMLIAYLIVGGIVFVTMMSLGEMVTYIPVAGSFVTFAG